MWGITRVEHPPVREVRDLCGECVALASGAVGIARATGSTAATETCRGHSVTVARVYGLVEP